MDCQATKLSSAHYDFAKAHVADECMGPSVARLGNGRGAFAFRLRQTLVTVQEAGKMQRLSCSILAVLMQQGSSYM